MKFSKHITFIVMIRTKLRGVS